MFTTTNNAEERSQGEAPFNQLRDAILKAPDGIGDELEQEVAQVQLKAALGNVALGASGPEFDNIPFGD